MEKSCYWKDHYESSKLYKDVVYREHPYLIEKRMFNYNYSISLINTRVVCQGISERKSVRNFSDSRIPFLTLCELLQNALFSINDGKYGYPSAGGIYELEIIIIIKNIDSIDDGIYHINMAERCLAQLKKGDYTKEIYAITQNQESSNNSNICVVICCNFEKTISKYDERGYRYIFLDAGHCAENFYIISNLLQLGCVAIGGFLDEELKELIGFENDYFPIYMLQIGVEDN